MHLRPVTKLSEACLLAGLLVLSAHAYGAERNPFSPVPPEAPASAAVPTGAGPAPAQTAKGSSLSGAITRKAKEKEDPRAHDIVEKVDANLIGIVDGEAVYKGQGVYVFKSMHKGKLVREIGTPSDASDGALPALPPPTSSSMPPGMPYAQNGFNGQASRPFVPGNQAGGSAFPRPPVAGAPAAGRSVQNPMVHR